MFNELLTIATGGTDTVFTYNDWGRTISKAIPGHTGTWRQVLNYQVVHQNLMIRNLMPFTPVGGE
jgi:YD repeat-containing protein